MSDEQAETTTSDEQQAAEKAKRTRTTHPLRVYAVGAAGALQLVAGSPEFREQREWDAWVLANGKPGTAYAPARVGPTVKLAVQAVLTEVD